jgi:P pilus assembly chaperone PapD
MSFSLKKIFVIMASFYVAIFDAYSFAAGMVPETSVVLINVGDGESTINITNTDENAALLYTSLENLPEDDEDFLIVTPPVTRVEAGEKQQVRFIVQTDRPITTQRLKRVSFEGIPHKDPNAGAQVAMTVRQNLPVLVTPADLPRKLDPWTLLAWSVQGQHIVARNDSRYVVRMNQQINVMPAEITLTMPRTYLLPGQSVNLELPADFRWAPESTVRIYPASTYGYQVKQYDAPLTR